MLDTYYCNYTLLKDHMSTSEPEQTISMFKQNLNNCLVGWHIVRALSPQSNCILDFEICTSMMLAALTKLKQVSQNGWYIWTCSGSKALIYDKCFLPLLSSLSYWLLKHILTCKWLYNIFHLWFFVLALKKGLSIVTTQSLVKERETSGLLVLIVDL